MRLAMNGIVSFSGKPLVYVTVIGAGIRRSPSPTRAYLVVLRLFFGNVVTGYASLMGALLFLGGMQLMATGVVGIYLRTVFQEVKARPTYVVGALRGLEAVPNERTAMVPSGRPRPTRSGRRRRRTTTSTRSASTRSRSWRRSSRTGSWARPSGRSRGARRW